MKILCMADFHISSWLETFILIERIQQIPCVYEVVVIAGDLFERNFLDKNDPYRVLKGIFPDLPVIFCLGNHEFVNKDYEQVLDFFRREKSNIHCLDVEGNVQVGKYNFVGNALWYDDSMSIYARKVNYDFPTKKTSDYLFNPREKFEDCLQQIKDNCSNSRKNILVTHTCPHFSLNGHRHTGEGSNSYAGSINLLESLEFSYSICGHTHTPASSKVNGCYSINVGSCKGHFRYYLLDAS